jgi:hypothetical protein
MADAKTDVGRAARPDGEILFVRSVQAAYLKQVELC